MSAVVIGELLAPTPPAWFALAAGRRDELLLDHANCEKKAASTALAFMFAYPGDVQLCARMSRLAREELRHFELVHAKLVQREVTFRRLSPSRYAAGLRRAVRTLEPGRCVDLLLMGALIEARSHERFVGLGNHLDADLAGFYTELAVAEQRHARLYLQLATRRGHDVESRWSVLASIEAEIATRPDPQFRFHSGPPAA